MNTFIFFQQAYQQQGFNLIELLLTLVVASFLMGYAVPSYQRMIEQQSQTTELARLQAVLNHTRLIASLNNKTLLVCHSSNGESCSNSPTANGDLLIVTTDNNQQPVFFSRGAGYQIVLPSHNLLIHPLPSQVSGSSLLSCTGFSRVVAKGLTLSNTGRVRINDGTDSDTANSIASLAAQCPN